MELFHVPFTVQVADVDEAMDPQKSPFEEVARVSRLKAEAISRGPEDLVIITADHGCDPAYAATTDHTREYVPLLVLGKTVKPGNLGTRTSFADIAATVSEQTGIPVSQLNADEERRLLQLESELSERCAATVCSTDHYVLRALKRLGITGAHRIAGFDNASAAFSLGIRVATVDYSTDAIAAECMSYFLRRKYNPKIPHSVLLG